VDDEVREWIWGFSLFLLCFPPFFRLHWWCVLQKLILVSVCIFRYSWSKLTQPECRVLLMLDFFVKTLLLLWEYELLSFFFSITTWWCSVIYLFLLFPGANFILKFGIMYMALTWVASRSKPWWSPLSTQLIRIKFLRTASYLRWELQGHADTNIWNNIRYCLMVDLVCFSFLLSDWSLWWWLLCFLANVSSFASLHSGNGYLQDGSWGCFLHCSFPTCGRTWWLHPCSFASVISWQASPHFIVWIKFCCGTCNDSKLYMV
jgi:hypothetical protein